MTTIRLSAAAESDILVVLARTDEQFGRIARLRYEALLATALQDVAADPHRPGSLARPELGAAVRSFHLRYSRQRARIAEGVVHRPRHLLLYRILRPELIGVGRVLHDAMDLERHLPSDYGEG